MVTLTRNSNSRDTVCSTRLRVKYTGGTIDVTVHVTLVSRECFLIFLVAQLGAGSRIASANKCDT